MTTIVGTVYDPPTTPAPHLETPLRRQSLIFFPQLVCFCHALNSFFDNRREQMLLQLPVEGGVDLETVGGLADGVFRNVEGDVEERSSAFVLRCGIRIGLESLRGLRLCHYRWSIV